MRTEAALRRILSTWQKRLKMDHIVIELQLDGDDVPGPEALAWVRPDDLYDRAEMGFRDDWTEHPIFDLNRIVVHELLHIMFRDMGNAVRSIGEAGVLSHQVQVLWYDRCNDVEEALIDRLAHRLVEIGGVVK